MQGFVAAVVAVPFVFLSFAGAQNRTAAMSAPTIHATVNEVALDFVARDKHGKLVKNLQPGDVQIYEDGVLQKILSFRLAEGGTIAGEQTSGTNPGAVTAGGVPAPPPALPVRTANLICVVLHDQNNLDASMKQFTMKAVFEFLQSHWQPDTWVGIFSLGSRLKVLYPFSTNRAELMQATANGFTAGTFQLSRMADAVLNGTPNMDLLVGVYPSPQYPNGVKETFQTGGLNNAAIMDVQQGTDLASSLQRGDLVDQQRDFGHIQGSQSIDQIKLMIGEFAQLPGHKTVLMLSAGLPSNGDPEQFDALLRKARQADISVYALDTNGLSQNSNVLAANQAVQYAGSVSQQQSTPAYQANNPDGLAQRHLVVGVIGREAELMRQDEYVHNAVRGSDTQAPLRALSEGTGGFLIGGGNDLRKPFQQLIEDVGTHYEAVYRPTSGKYDGHMRKIAVKLSSAELTVDSRRGYFAVPDLGGGVLAPFEMAGLMALNSNPAPHTFDFRSSAYQFRPESTTNQVGIAFELPSANVTAVAEPEQKAHRLNVAVVALVKDGSGAIVDKFSQDSTFEIPDDKLAEVQNLPITWTHPFDLAPGHYTVETAVLDRAGNRVSTSVLPLDSPDRKGLSLSSVALVRRMAPVQDEADAANPFQYNANRVIPLLNPLLKQGGQQYVYFVVYPNKTTADQPMLGVEFRVNGKLVVQKTADLPSPDASGAIPMLMEAMIQPGDCELKITAMQGYAMATRSVKYTVPAQ